ncbi:MAG: hypothetical protein ACRD3J_25300, partial [Thermoanaerobaculia bacterium]
STYNRQTSFANGRCRCFLSTKTFDAHVDDVGPAATGEESYFAPNELTNGSQRKMVHAIDSVWKLHHVAFTAGSQ